MNRTEALALMEEHTQSPSLRQHMLAVEAAMRAYAEQRGEDPETWGMVGLLHDFDYEKFPNHEHSPTDGHPAWGVRLLREKGVPEPLCRAILGHGTYTGVPRDTLMAQTLFAVDELCGFLVACALVRPSKSFADLAVSSVKKKLKDKGFARGVIRDDATGRRFADALAERARAGVRVRVLYDALGSFGTSRRYWRRLTQAGAEVRAFHPLLTRHALDLLARDHRKLLVADGVWAMTGGLCIGDEWAGDPARGRRPWRDTMVAVSGPAASALDGTFARIWRRAGTALPPDELDADPASNGDSTVRAVEGVPA